MKIQTLIKTTDFLGEEMKFSINKYSSFQTVAGGILSILISILYIYFFYIFGLDFIFKQNPNVYSQIKPINVNDIIPKIYLNNSEFIFGVRLEDYNGNNVEMQKYLFPRFNYAKYFLNRTTNEFEIIYIPIEVIKCDKFEKSLKEIPKSPYNLSTFFCPDFSQIKEGLQIGGYWDDLDFKYLQLDLSICSDLNFTDCKDVNIIDERTSKEPLLISIIYPEVIFYADNYTKPFQYRFKNYYNFLSRKIQIMDEIFLGHNILTQDAGLMLEDKVEENTTSIMRINSKFNFPTVLQKDDPKKINVYTNDLYSCCLIFYKNYYSHTRRYAKLQDLIANVKGFMELIVFILGIFYKIYSKHRLDAYLFNRLLIIKEDKKEIKLNHNMINFKETNKNQNLFNSKIFIEDQSEIRNIKNQGDKKVELRIKPLEISNKSDLKIKGNSLILDMCENLSKNQTGNSFIQKNIELSEINVENQNNFVRNISDEEIDKVITEYLAFKNKLDFNLFNLLKYSLGLKRKKGEQNHIFKYYTDKINNKFDIFTYLKFYREFQLFKILFSNEETSCILKLFSRKMYIFNSTENQIENTKNNQKSIKEEKLKTYFKNNLAISKQEKILDLIFYN